MYYLGCTSDKIWDYPKLINYLSSNQNKDIKIKIEPEAICLRKIGLYDILDCFTFNNVIIHTNNPIESHDKYTIIHNRVDVWTANPNADVLEHHTWNFKKKFLCLYGRPTAGRLGIGCYVAKHHTQHAHVHYSFPVIDNEYNFEIDKLLTYRIESIAEVGEMLPQMPVTLESTKHYTAFNGYDYADPLTRYYQDIFVDLVVESHVAGNTFFPTEKTFRPMWLKKPFIIFASKDYLCYLRQMGFRTFADFWDEDYDGYDGRERYNKILELINKIAETNTNQLESMYLDMQYTLDYNYNMLTTKSYNTNITKIT